MWTEIAARGTVDRSRSMKEHDKEPAHLSSMDWSSRSNMNGFCTVTRKWTTSFWTRSTVAAELDFP
jgi:hypothetical protein